MLLMIQTCREIDLNTGSGFYLRFIYSMLTGSTKKHSVFVSASHKVSAMFFFKHIQLFLTEL